MVNGRRRHGTRPQRSLMSTTFFRYCFSACSFSWRTRAASSDAAL